MTGNSRVPYLYAFAIPAFACCLTSCAASRAPFTASFLPAAPASTVAELDEPPRISSGLYKSESPNLLNAALTPARAVTEVDRRLSLAQARFDEGRKLYQEGDLDAARREFDGAIDTLLTAPDELADRQRIERKLDELVDRIFRYDLDGMGVGASEEAGIVYERSPKDTLVEMTFPTDPKLQPRVKQEIQATASQLPLDANESVLSAIHYFSTSGRNTILGGMKRAGKYQALIERILDEEGVPRELLHLAQVESGFSPHALSNRAAVGMWQFVQWRGKEYGLEQTAYSDDRLDPEKATRAAARHLRDLYNHFGDWYLAMAAYDCGPGCVDRAIQRTGFADFWELRSRNVLPRETMNYVPVILAMTIMAKNPGDYGLEGIVPDQPVEYDSIELAAATNLNLIADASDRSIPELRDLNPSLLSAMAPAGYKLRLPKGQSSAVLAALEAIPEIRRASWRMHRVERGESLAQIAKHFNTPASAIAAANTGVTAGPQEGDMLIIPASYQPRRPVVHTASYSRSSHRAHHASYSASTHTVSDRVLHHRATARTYKTASLNTRSRRIAN